MLKKSFTLAEVLSVFVILGVVAAITAPITINKTQDYILKVKRKKTFSTFSKVIETMNVENNMNLNSVCNGNEYCAVNEFAKYITVTKKCSSGQTYGDGKCFVKTSDLKCFDGSKANPNWYYDSGFVTNDGVNVVIWYWSDKKYVYGKKRNEDGTTTDLYQVGYKLIFDVNGHKGPNTFGKDIFAVNVNTKTATLEPMGMYPERGVEEWFMYGSFTGEGCGLENAMDVYNK